MDKYRQIKGKNIANKNSINSNQVIMQKMVVYFLSFCVLFVLALQPLLIGRSNGSLDAGWTFTDKTYFANAPMYVANGTTSAGKIIDAEPLFTSDGINTATLFSLINLVNDSKVWGSKTINSNGNTYLTAKDFGKIDSNGNGQIVVKLFDDKTITDANGLDVSKATQLYWQAVYRSINNTQDILTLYMVDSYATAQFNPNTSTTLGDRTYTQNADYSKSILRHRYVLPLYDALVGAYDELDDYIIAPQDIPGEWQSSLYQTSMNKNRKYY